MLLVDYLGEIGYYPIAILIILYYLDQKGHSVSANYTYFNYTLKNRESNPEYIYGSTAHCELNLNKEIPSITWHPFNILIGASLWYFDPGILVLRLVYNNKHYEKTWEFPFPELSDSWNTANLNINGDTWPKLITGVQANDFFRVCQVMYHLAILHQYVGFSVLLRFETPPSVSLSLWFPILV